MDRLIKLYLPQVGICLLMQVGIVSTGLLLQHLLNPQSPRVESNPSSTALVQP